MVRKARNRTYARLAGAFLALWAVGHVSAPSAFAGAKHASVLLYHRFGEDAIPSTNTSLADFEAHLRILRDEGYAVVSLPRLLEALEGGAPLPPKSVVITIDDGYRSVFEEAWPRLREYGFPFAVFVASGEIDASRGNLMDWSALRELARDPLVSVFHHSRSHAHMIALDGGARARDFADDEARLEAELGTEPQAFAYPYGEYDTALQAQVQARGHRAAFGQHSGVVGPQSPRFALPRFSLSGSFSGEDRLRLALEAKPLVVSDLVPAAPPLADADFPLEIRFSVAHAEGALAGLACFLGGKPQDLEISPAREVRLRVDTLPRGRSRLNCTLRDDDGAWRWFGALYYRSGADD